MKPDDVDDFDFSDGTEYREKKPTLDKRIGAHSWTIDGRNVVIDDWQRDKHTLAWRRVQVVCIQRADLSDVIEFLKHAENSK